MNIAEGWNMYLDSQDLKAKHFNISQIFRRLDLSRTTVYKYLDMTPEEMEQFLERQKKRAKKLDKHPSVRGTGLLTIRSIIYSTEKNENSYKKEQLVINYSHIRTYKPLKLIR